MQCWHFSNSLTQGMVFNWTETLSPLVLLVDIGWLPIHWELLKNLWKQQTIYFHVVSIGKSRNVQPIPIPKSWIEVYDRSMQRFSAAQLGVFLDWYTLRCFLHRVLVVNHLHLWGICFRCKFSCLATTGLIGKLNWCKVFFDSWWMSPSVEAHMELS